MQKLKSKPKLKSTTAKSTRAKVDYKKRYLSESKKAELLAKKISSFEEKGYNFRLSLEEMALIKDLLYRLNVSIVDEISMIEGDEYKNYLLKDLSGKKLALIENLYRKINLEF